MSKQTFALGAILSVRTGILQCDFDELHKLLSHMIDDPYLTQTGMGLVRKKAQEWFDNKFEIQIPKGCIKNGAAP